MIQDLCLRDKSPLLSGLSSCPRTHTLRLNPNQLRHPFRHRDHRCVDVGPHAGRHDRSVDHPQPRHTPHRTVLIDGDNRRDIWTTKADVFASAANYLARSGWRDDQTWGRKVSLPAGFDMSLADLKLIKRLSEWQSLGVRRADGSDLPKRDLEASLVLPGGAGGPAYIIYGNYRAILKWNRSNYFAVSVGHLADLIGDG